MEKLYFADGDKFGVYDGERVRLYESEYIARYREYAASRTKNDEWKYGGEGARFRGDYAIYEARSAEAETTAFINGVGGVGDKVYYSFTVDASSGVYCKDVSQEKAREEHILTSSDDEIVSLQCAEGMLAVTVRRQVTSSIGLLDVNSSELKTLTEGDSLDENPVFCPYDPDLLFFDSAGVGRDAQGAFTGKYAPAQICSLNLVTMELKEVLKDGRCSYVKPKFAPNGDLYCICRPNKEKGSGNVFLDILLFPFRILKAIFGFLQAFVQIFGHTSLTSATAGGDNPARGRDADARKLYIDGRLLDVERETKRNRRKKDKEYGFIPQSWKLVRVTDGGQEVVRTGVCDYALCADGGVYFTNGRYVFYLKDGKTQRIADTDCCLTLAVEGAAHRPSDALLP